MMRRISATAAMLALVLMACGSEVTNASAAPTTLAPITNDSGLSAYGGWVVWSEQLRGGRWALTAWHRGHKARLPVLTRDGPFDADVGPDRHGRPVVVFSRCVGEPPPTRGWSVLRFSAATACGLSRLVLGSGHEVQLRPPGPAGASIFVPSQWRGQIAFARRRYGSDTSELMLWKLASNSVRRLRGGDLPHMCPKHTVCDPNAFDGDVEKVDLGFRGAAFLWQVTAPTVSGVGSGWELFVDLLPGRAQTLIASGSSGGTCGGAFPGSPNVAGSGVWFLDRIYDCDTLHTHVALGDDVSGGVSSVETAPDLAWELARDGRSLYTVRGPRITDPPTNDLPCEGAMGPCSLAVQVLPKKPIGGGVPSPAIPPFTDR